VKGDMPEMTTRIGHAEWGDNRFCGHSVARDLAGREGYVGLLALSIAGRRLAPDERALLDDLSVVISTADPRIWPLKLVRVTAAFGGCLSAVAAATLLLEGALIGPHVTGQAAELLLAVSAALASSDDTDAVLERECRRLLAPGRRLAGLGVPFRPEDERLTMLSERVEARGRAGLPYWTLFVRVRRAFRRIKKLETNIGLGAAAVCHDIGFNPRQTAILLVALGQNDFWSNAVEGAAQAPALLRRLPPTHLRYVGRAPRLSPRAMGR
jgi:hypothetical protein